jgi:DNA repair protein RecN (Recombination protein N)
LLFSANPGEEPRQLSKVVSGGELSRIALAIKATSARHDDIGTMIFDEVDAGIGGQTGQMVAEKIAIVAAQKQVLCITHLPQIACMADQHIYIEKRIEQDQTYAYAKILGPDARLPEIARMISGNKFSQAVINNAADMLKCAEDIKEKWKNKA